MSDMKAKPMNILPLITRRVSKSKFMAHNPTLLGTCMGVSFYEHPHVGDEAPCIAVYGDVCGHTDVYEVPTWEEMCDMLGIRY